MRTPFVISDNIIAAGENKTVHLTVPDLYTHTGITLPVHVVHGRRDGPVLFLSAAVHGDEINGVEIIRRILRQRQLRSLTGTLLAVPVVNIYGFLNKTRYLPDRRDLNRSFPGSDTGSLAARMAHVFLTEIVARSTHGIDLHTAAIHRDNLPQVRALLDDKQTEDMARAFALPVILNAGIVPGSLREAAEKLGCTIIVYEAGEALRFDEASIRAGVKGVLSVMRDIGMLGPRKKSVRHKALIARSSTWVRAPQSGILRSMAKLGDLVQKDDLLGVVSDPLGSKEENVHASSTGIIIGRTNIPLVNEGEALFHIARFRYGPGLASQFEDVQNLTNPDTYDEIKSAEPPIV